MKNQWIDATSNKREDSCFEHISDGDSQHVETLGYSIPYHPEDIWHRIHSMLPMRDAARAACLSHTFLHFWRCHPNLTLDWKTLCQMAPGRKFKNFMAPGRNFSCRVDSILRNHSGIGIKTLKLDLSDDPRTLPYVEGWLQVAVTPGIEELTVKLYEKENFPCSLLSDGVRNSIRCLRLVSCAFHPSVELGPFRSLTNLRLDSVRITGDELECLLSKSLALEQLYLCDCRKVTSLKIPCVLLQLSSLSIMECTSLQMIEIKAPNLYHIDITGNMKLSFGDASRVKEFTLWHMNSVCYARTELPATMPNLETLSLCSDDEVIITPMLPTKFLYLKHLAIYITSSVALSPSCDYLSLISFFDASPSLETLFLDVSQKQMEHESVFDGSPHLRQLPECRHDCLKSVEIIGFSSAKVWVELTCCIVKNADSLERIVLDTLPDQHPRCSGENSMPCMPVRKNVLQEAIRTIEAIRTFIEAEVPPTAKLIVKEPCARCHYRG